MKNEVLDLYGMLFLEKMYLQGGRRMKCKCGKPGHRLPGGFVVCEKCFPKAVAAFNEWLEEEE